MKDILSEVFAFEYGVRPPERTINIVEAKRNGTYILADVGSSRYELRCDPGFRNLTLRMIDETK